VISFLIHGGAFTLKRHCTKVLLSLRSRRQHKAWGASPRIDT